MRVELLVTGDEIVRGATLDTNSPWLMQRLRDSGVPVSRISVVGDVRTDLLAAMREAASRADVVICSGGLGPTSDDLTAECAAEAAGVELVHHPETLARIKERWARRAKPMPPAVEKQSWVPAGAEVLTNDAGTAPGFRLKWDRAECFFFAGVPREFMHLCEAHVLPWLAVRSERAVVTRTLRCVNIPESEIDALLLSFAEQRGLKLGLRAAYPETWATLTAEEVSKDKASARVESALVEAERLLQPHCFSIKEETLAAVVGQLLLVRNATVSVAESCTGGLLGGALTEVAGSSRYVLGGAITYSNEEKTRALGVPPDLFLSHGAVSEPVVRAMAAGVRERTCSTYSLAITGVAGPGGGTLEKPVGTVCIGVATPRGVKAAMHRFTRPDRPSIRAASVAAALDLLRRELLEADS